MSQATPPRSAFILADYAAPYPGSFIPSMRALADELGGRGWEVQFGFPAPAAERLWLEQLRAEGRRVAIGPAGAGDAELSDWIGGLLEDAPGAAVLHTHFTAYELPALTAARGRAQTSVIWHVHTYLTRRPPSRFARQLVKYGWLARRVDRIVCVGPATAREIRLRGARDDRVVVIRNGIDTAAFPLIDPAEREHARAVLGVAGHEVVLAHFGWEWQGKGGPLFARALALARERGLDAIGLAVGGGAAAAAEAAALGLGDALVPCEPRADVRSLYAAADALVATSVGEGGDPTFSILEALCCGTSVVGTDIPGHRVGPDGPESVHLTPADPAPLADSFAVVAARDVAAREREAHAGRDWVVARRGLDGPARELADVYEELASDSV
jgi:glycosyltransferase involved in cell wall biosynthesis